MAWTGQCQIAFKVDVDKYLAQQNGKKSIRKALRKFSRESGIPYATLAKWYWPQSAPKNGSKKVKQSRPVDENNREICIRCNDRPVKILTSPDGKKKYIGETGKFYGLCNRCIEKQREIEKLDKMATQENGIMAICPHCQEIFLINSSRLKGVCHEQDSADGFVTE